MHSLKTRQEHTCQLSVAHQTTKHLTATTHSSVTDRKPAATDSILARQQLPSMRQTAAMVKKSRAVPQLLLALLPASRWWHCRDRSTPVAVRSGAHASHRSR